MFYENMSSHLTAITLGSTDVKFGDRNSWKYTTDGTGSDINSFYLKFASESGNIKLRDNERWGWCRFRINRLHE